MKRIAIAFAAIALLASTVVYASGSLLWARKHSSTKLEKDEEWIEAQLAVTDQSVTSLEGIEDTGIESTDAPVEIIDSTVVEEETEETVTSPEEPTTPEVPEEPETTEVPEESELPETTEAPEQPEEPEAPVATEAVDDSMDDIPVTYVEAQEIDFVGTPDEDISATPDEAETIP